MDQNKEPRLNCVEELKKLESEYKQALQNSNMVELATLRQKIKQQNEKLSTQKRYQHEN